MGPLVWKHPSVNAGNIQDGIRPWGVAELPFETGYVSIHSGPFRDNGQASSEPHLPEESGAIKQEQEKDEPARTESKTRPPGISLLKSCREFRLTRL